ncbi:MAG TPA: carboxyl transferase domain-containing protein [Solirubrobacteraceae bacterium]|jgi:acetyl-CoA carboxylase carboxyltransferase component|nr:carboxyl transferase domain-containing protein [Solirubrobacteraceae bacterium]
MSLAVAPRPVEKLGALDRLEVLCDPGSLQLIRTDVLSGRMGARAQAGDGVVGGAGRVDGRPVYCYAQDAGYAGGSLGEAHADTIVRVLRLAARARVPVVGFVESAGARLQEGVGALGGYGRIFAENVRLGAVVPQITVIGGASAGGGSYSPALTDFVVMTEAATMFLTGPSVVADVMGERLSAAELGGARVHERNGVSHFTAPTDVDAALLARDLLDYLPQRVGARPARWPAADPPRGLVDAAVPAEQRGVYDVRSVVRGLADGGRLLEVSPRWARNLVTAFARLDGRAVGVIANQPRHLGGVLDAESAQKGARFVRACDRFGLPLVVLVDTPGFLPGSGQERAGVIRHGAQLVHAFAAAAVPKVTVVLRKAFGGAFIAMNSKELGADLVLAWPGAQLGVMGPRQAVGIVHRREIAAADDPDAAAERLAREYASEHLDARAAAASGAIDEVVPPSETRLRLAHALDALSFDPPEVAP